MRDLRKLDGLMADWKQTLAARLGAEVADELESHLRELLESELAAGAGLDEAWQRATRKLGDARSLNREFRKLQRFVVLDWIFVVCVIMVIMGLLLPFHAKVRHQVDALGANRLLSTHVLTLTYGYTAALAGGVIGLYAACRALLGRSSNSAITRWVPRLIALLCGGVAVLSAVGFVLGAIWAHRSWGRAWNWDAREIGCVLVMLYHAWLCYAGFARRITADMLLALATVGTAVTAAAWYGPLLIETGTHAYGMRGTEIGILLAVVFGVSAAMTLLAARRGRPATL